MTHRIRAVALGWLALTCSVPAATSNWWPLLTMTPAEDRAGGDRWTAAGPFLESRLLGEERITSFRPLWTQFEHTEREAASYHLLYPLLSVYDYEGAHHWHVLNLLRSSRSTEPEHRELDLFPFYFSRQTGQPETSYRALWPLGGTLKNFFGRDRIDFALWPLYIRTERQAEVRYSVPWPFFQKLTGPGSRGWALWPFYGHFEREGSYDHTWALWPLYYNLHNGLGQEVPYHRLGVLPFYHRETAAGLRSETYLWPFFGYTRESDPRPDYRETRYFWPLLVQGRGEEKYVNRWLPLYTHETRPGTAKHWYLWPLLKHQQFEDPGLTRDRTQFLFFLYWDEQQSHAATDFSARRTYLWPLLGYANNGEGRRQVQVLDLFGVFFPHNEKIRENWSPLFALYRYQSDAGSSRHSVLWDFVVFEQEADDTGAVYLGPLFEHVDEGETGHWKLFKGLIGRERSPDGKRWTFFWNTF